MAKQMLTTGAIEAQAALALPDRELMSLIDVGNVNILNNLTVLLLGNDINVVRVDHNTIKVDVSCNQVNAVAWSSSPSTAAMPDSRTGLGGGPG